MPIGHHDLLGTIHELTFIAAIDTFHLSIIRYFKTPPDNLGGVHISS